MKKQKLIAIVATMTLSSYIAASPLDDMASKTSNKEIQFIETPPDFGSYIVERNLQLIPAALASSNEVVVIAGNMAVVEVDEPSNLVTEGSLVRNVFTHRLAPLSGNITVLLKTGVDAKHLEQETGIVVATSYVGSKLVVVKVREGEDVLTLQRRLMHSGLVKETKIEVLEIVYEVD